MFIRLTETTSHATVIVNTEQINKIRPIDKDEVIIYMRDGDHIYADISFDKLAGLLLRKDMLVYDN